MSNTIRRMILGMQTVSISGDYLVEIQLREWSDEDMKCLYLYAIQSPSESETFFGISANAQWQELLTARQMGQVKEPAECQETFDVLEAAARSAYGPFYEMADHMIQNMKKVYEVEEAEEEEEIDLSEYEIPENKEELFRRRLSLETDVAWDSIFHDSDVSGFEYEKKYVRALIAACESEGEYVFWKKNYIESAFEATKERGIVVCSYIFNGYGHYGMILPQEELHPFQGWLQMSGAMDAGLRDATDEEIRIYIGMQAGRK